jgi:ABC-type branched-subunit amino acid transport system ATPase component
MAPRSDWSWLWRWQPAPQLLLLDEPAAGLAGPERASLMQLVKSLAGQGMTVLYTEHNMDAVAGVADRVLVLIEGKLAAQGSFDEISRDPVVRSRYLGEGPVKGSTMLDVQHLNAFYGPAQALFDVSLQVAPGELVVLQGLNGAGKSTLLKSLMGLEVRTEGHIHYQAADEA